MLVAVVWESSEESNKNRVSSRLFNTAWLSKLLYGLIMVI